MRADEAAAQMPHSYTTARTLLSILRLSQALARLRFATSVAQVRLACFPGLLWGRGPGWLRGLRAQAGMVAAL